MGPEPLRGLCVSLGGVATTVGSVLLPESGALAVTFGNIDDALILAIGLILWFKLLATFANRLASLLTRRLHVASAFDSCILSFLGGSSFHLFLG